MDRNYADLPESVDVVIFGTDVTQSILAAACARNGMTVLHLDRNDYYGDKSCVFTLNAIEELVTSSSKAHSNGIAGDSADEIQPANDAEEILYLPTKDAENFEVVSSDYPCVAATLSASEPPTLSASASPVENLETTSGEQQEMPNQVDTLQTAGASDNMAADCASPTVAASHSVSTDQWTKEKLIAASRRFNIDMSPNLVYSTGKTVELLVSSDVSRYVEFKNIGRLYVFNGQEFEHVPCSRSDVFSDGRLSLVEKRLLMRLFATAMDYETKVTDENIPTNGLFVDYLRETCRLPDRLVYYVQHAISMVSGKCSTLEGLNRTRNFLKSCSIYGPTPFLWPMYGCAEFPQAFCRLAAVYGAVYVLRSSPLAIARNKESGKPTAVILENGKRVACQFIASSSSYCPAGLLNKVLQSESTSPLGYDLALRAVLLSDKSLYPADSSQPYPLVTFGRVPNAKFTASMIELPDHAMVCPSGTFLHQITAPLVLSEKRRSSIEDHKLELDEFNKFLSKLFNFNDSSVENDEKPKVFWRLVFSKPYLAVNKTSEDLEAADFVLAENIFVVPDALTNGSSLDFDLSIAIAKAIFKQIKPDAEEFIPKMPQPPVSEDLTSGGDDIDAVMPEQPSDQQQVENIESAPANPPESNAESANEPMQ